MEPRIVCAANRYHNGPILIGARHCDQHMYVQAQFHGITMAEPNTQGFIDQFGNFYNRQEAWKIAKKNNQIIRDHDKCVGMLFSEHLY